MQRLEQFEKAILAYNEALRWNVYYLNFILPVYYYSSYVMLDKQYLYKFQLHAVSRTQQNRQRESYIKRFRSPFSAEFWIHFTVAELNDALFASTSERINRNIHTYKYLIYINISFYHVVIEPTINRVYSHTLVTLRHDWPTNQVKQTDRDRQTGKLNKFCFACLYYSIMFC